MASKNGQTVLYMKDNGSITKPVGVVLFGMLKVIFTSVNSEQIKQMGLESIHMLMEAGTPANGLTMFKKAKEKKSGLTVQTIKESIKMGRSMAMEFTCGATIVNSMGIGKIIK
jgi:hypothetical protein